MAKNCFAVRWYYHSGIIDINEKLSMECAEIVEIQVTNLTG